MPWRLLNSNVARMTINWFLAESIIDDRGRELRLADARRWPEVGRAQRLAASRLATTRPVTTQHDLVTGSRESRGWARVWRIATANVRPIGRTDVPAVQRETSQQAARVPTPAALAFGVCAE